MIKFKNATILDCVPGILADQPEIKALAAAVKTGMDKYISMIDAACIYSGLSTAPENILDVLAVELQVPAYKETYTLSVKRSLVTGALTWWLSAGSGQTVEDLCKTIFQDATLYEWFEYGADAGHFKISTTNPLVTSGNVDEFKRAATSVKRLSQHLDTVDLLLTCTADVYEGIIVRAGTISTLNCNCKI
jgi:phage tail P2-like protein